MTGTRPSTGVAQELLDVRLGLERVVERLDGERQTDARSRAPASARGAGSESGFGRTGMVGTIARSSTRTLFVFIGPVMSISFCRVAMIPYIFSSCSDARWSGLYSTSIFDSSMASFFCCSIRALSACSLSSELLVGLLERRQNAVDLLLVGLPDALHLPLDAPSSSGSSGPYRGRRSAYSLSRAVRTNPGASRSSPSPESRAASPRRRCCPARAESSFAWRRARGAGCAARSAWRSRSPGSG